MAAVEYTREGRIACITINRPEAMNALNSEVQKGLHDAMVDFKNNDDLWVAILTGAGDRAFCAGADIKDFRPFTGDVNAAGRVPEAPIRADTIWKPFIAAIHGYCLGGGCRLAMTCDIRIAAENAQFGQPEISIGFMPTGGALKMPKYMSGAIAAEILLTGSRINAWEALRAGFVSRVVPRDKLMDTAREIANTIITRGPLGVRATKEAMVRGYELDLEEGLALESRLNAYTRTTADFMEGARAFARKRPPNFQGK